MNANTEPSQSKVDSLIKVSKALRTQGKVSEAIEIYLSLIDELSNKSENVAYLYNVLSIAYRSKGEKALGLKYLYKAIDLNRLLKNDRNLVKNYINLANYFNDEEQYEKSKNYLLLAKSLMADKSDILNAYIYNSLGSYYNSQVDEQILNIDTSTNYYLRALQVYKDNNAYSLMAGPYNNIANNYLTQSKNRFAEEYYLKAIQIADSVNNNLSLVNSYRNLGNLFMEEKKYQSALESYNNSLSLSDVEKDPSYQIHILANLVNANIALGHVDEAAVLFQRFNELRDSIYNAEKLQEVKVLETKYETNLKEKEIKDQQITIATKNFEKNIFLSLTILMIILIVAAVWFFSQKQKYLRKLKNEEIANMKKEQELKELNAMMHGQEEERNRIANDLHDRLGARLSSIKLLFQNEDGVHPNGSKLVNHIDEAIKETREISHNLSSDILSRFGLQTALKDTIRTIQDSKQIQADLAIYGMDKRWPLDIERNIYYTLLELINNTLKHSDAKTLFIQISQVGEEVNIFYEDTGKGYDLKDVSSKGLGMRSLKARMNSIKAEMTIDTKPNAGFTAIIGISIPKITDSTIVNESSVK